MAYQKTDSISLNQKNQKADNVQDNEWSDLCQQSQKNPSQNQSNSKGNVKSFLFLLFSMLILILMIGFAHSLLKETFEKNQYQTSNKEQLLKILLSQNSEKYQQLIDQYKILQKKLQTYQKQLQSKQKQIEILEKNEKNLQHQNKFQSSSTIKKDKIQNVKQITEINDRSKNLEKLVSENSNMKIDKKLTNQTIQYRMKDIGSRKIPQVPVQMDKYEFKVSVEKLVENNLKNNINIKDFQYSPIKRPEFERAIRLMQVVHNVNFNGKFAFDHYNFYPSPEAKAQALLKVLQEEKQYFDQKYDINKYIHDQIGICVYVPSYNNAKNRLYLRNLDSIFQQEYRNYHLVYVNDASTDGTGEYVRAYMEENEIPAEKYVIINNEKNKGNCANIINAAHNYCKEGEIMILLDGDDSLIGRQVFSLLNAIYQKQKIALTYGQYLFVKQNQMKYGKASKPIPQKNLIEGSFRQLKNFYTSHLKTMYVDVFRQIPITDLEYQEGVFYQVASDVAYITSAIELVGSRLKFIHQFIYQYRFDTGQNDGLQKQRDVGPSIYGKKPSKKMQKMQFADNPKTVHYQ